MAKILCARCGHNKGDHWDQGPCGVVLPGQTESGDSDDCPCYGFVQPSTRSAVEDAISKSKGAKTKKWDGDWEREGEAKCR